MRIMPIKLSKRCLAHRKGSNAIFSLNELCDEVIRVDSVILILPVRTLMLRSLTPWNFWQCQDKSQVFHS